MVGTYSPILILIFTAVPAIVAMMKFSSHRTTNASPSQGTIQVCSQNGTNHDLILHNSKSTLLTYCNHVKFMNSSLRHHQFLIR